MRSHLQRLVPLFAAAVLFHAQADAAPVSARMRVSESLDKTSALQADVDAEVAFGREVAARILARFPMADAPEVSRYLNLVGNAVAANGNRAEIRFRFALVESDSVNAYAAPGGYVFLTTGALAAMKDESELAAVLAHEVAHINQKHVVSELKIRGTEHTPEAGLARILGASSDPARMAFSQAVDKAVDILFESGLKQADEFEADRLGTIAAAMAGYEPAALQRYLQRVAGRKSPHTTVLDKTHPPVAARTQRLDAVLDDEGLRSLAGAAGRSRFQEIRGKIDL